jgi:hypothetical protein
VYGLAPALTSTGFLTEGYPRPTPLLIVEDMTSTTMSRPALRQAGVTRASAGRQDPADPRLLLRVRLALDRFLEHAQHALEGLVVGGSEPGGEQPLLCHAHDRFGTRVGQATRSPLDEAVITQLPQRLPDRLVVRVLERRLHLVYIHGLPASS